MQKFLIISLLFLSIVGVLMFSPFTLVNPGHTAVLTQFGKVQEETLPEGFHFISPLDSVHEYDTRTQKIETESNAASKDLQTVRTSIALNFRVNPETVQFLFQETQGDYNLTLIAPAIQESVKAATAQFTAEELVTKRAQVREAMRNALTEREAMRFFIVEDLSIVDFAFSQSFNNAIENKVKAEQDALAAKNKLEQTKYEAEQRVVQAEAEAEAIRIQAEAVTQQGGKDYVQLQAISKWDGKLPNYMLGDGATPFVNIQ